MPELSDEELFAAVGGAIADEPQRAYTPLQERIVAGFEDILRFVQEHGRAPSHASGGDIFERLYAVRLDRLRALGEHHDVLRPLDTAGLLDAAAPDDDPMDDEALLERLGGLSPGGEASVTTLRHVRSSAEKRAAEEIANREPCPEFERFRPLFEAVQDDLDKGVRETRPFGRKAEIKVGRFFVLEGQKLYVAEVGEPFRQEYGDTDARLRVVYDNATQSNMLMRSLQRALTKDENGRRITEGAAGPLFGATVEADDIGSGTIYVLRSRSDYPLIAANRDLVHKVGVTGGSVEARIANARNDATYLLADVDVVAEYKLANIDRRKLERIIHGILAEARQDITIHDRFGKPVHPREWYLVPLPVIDELVERLRRGNIDGVRYDPSRGILVEAVP